LIKPVERIGAVGVETIVPTFAEPADFDESFEGPVLDGSRWIPQYLPHWSGWDRSAARYELLAGRLHLLIEEDQPPWCPDLDGELRVSSLQTGLIAGPVGSSVGTHPFDPPAVVRDGPHDIRRYTPTYGRFEIRMAASDDPRLMVAFWMIGLGDDPTRTGEICVVEIFGSDVSPNFADVGVGVKRQFDPNLGESFDRVRLPIDVREMHDYVAEWTPERVDFLVDGRVVKTVEQAIDYPMTLMLNVYEFPNDGAADEPRPYPKRFVVDRIRGHRLVR
jgi:hypothetical protein